MTQPAPRRSVPVFAAASTFVGIAILLVLVREVFHQLLHPEGRGFVSVAALRLCRWAARRMGTRAMVFAGPTSLGVVLGVWFAMAVFGWALLLLPHMPEGFTHANDIPEQHPFVDALYMSSVTISTLGFGDVVPATPTLRLLVPFQSVMGFGLLTASLTWLLSMYQPLARQRTLARQANRMLQRRELEGRHLQAITGMVAAATIDLNMHAALYYFHAEDERECLANVSVPLWDAARRLSGDPDHPASNDADALCHALDELAEVLVHDHLPWAAGPSTRDALRAWALDDHPRSRECEILADTHDGRAAAG